MKFRGEARTKLSSQGRAEPDARNASQQSQADPATSRAKPVASFFLPRITLQRFHGLLVRKSASSQMTGLGDQPRLLFLRALLLLLLACCIAAMASRPSTSADRRSCLHVRPHISSRRFPPRIDSTVVGCVANLTRIHVLLLAGLARTSSTALMLYLHHLLSSSMRLRLRIHHLFFFSSFRSSGLPSPRLLSRANQRSGSRAHRGRRIIIRRSRKHYESLPAANT